MKRILLVEDDEAHASAVDKALQSSGHEIFKVGDGEAAIEFLTGNLVDLVILDWKLPKMSGLDVSRWMRAHLGSDPGVAAERACALAPDYLLALRICSNVLKELQEWDSALALIQRGLTLNPGGASMMWSLAMLQLLRGDYAAGWPSHEGRWDGSPELRNSLPYMSAPRWQGNSLAGRTLFVWSEQGYGDVIQFVRFLPLIAERIRREGASLSSAVTRACQRW